MTALDVVPVLATVGGGFLAGTLIGYAVKKVLKFVAVIAGLFIAGLAYLQYQHVIIIDWTKLEGISQNGITTLANALTHISNNIGADHAGVTTNLALPNFGIPLASGVSAGFALGLTRG
jgi:uncharacterized membrane protein (Fun14 family)